MKKFSLLSGYVSPTTPGSIYVIPIHSPEQDIRVPSASLKAWEQLPFRARSQDTLSSQQHNSTCDKWRNSLPKCCICYRGHKVGVDVPKCCAIGIAEDHLFEHFFDDLIHNENACMFASRDRYFILWNIWWTYHWRPHLP